MFKICKLKSLFPEFLAGINGRDCLKRNVCEMCKEEMKLQLLVPEDHRGNMRRDKALVQFVSVAGTPSCTRPHLLRFSSSHRSDLQALCCCHACQLLTLLTSKPTREGAPTAFTDVCTTFPTVPFWQISPQIPCIADLSSCARAAGC